MGGGGRPSTIPRSEGDVKEEAIWEARAAAMCGCPDAKARYFRVSVTMAGREAAEAAAAD